jgi:hypothetical protein
MPEIGMSVSMSGDGKRSVGHRPQATAPILDSTTPSVTGVSSARQPSGDKLPNQVCAWFLAIRASRRHAATSSTSVGSSSPLPVLLTRRDTGHMRRGSSAAGRGNSAPLVPFSQDLISALSSSTGMRS